MQFSDQNWCSFPAKQMNGCKPVRVVQDVYLDWNHLSRLCELLRTPARYSDIGGGDSSPTVFDFECVLNWLPLRDKRSIACCSKSAAVSIRHFTEASTIRLNPDDATFANAVFVARLPDLEHVEIGKDVLHVHQLRNNSRIKMGDIAPCASLFLGAIVCFSGVTLRLSSGTDLRAVSELRRSDAGGQAFGTFEHLSLADRSALLIPSCVGKKHATEMCKSVIGLYVSPAPDYVRVRVTLTLNRPQRTVGKTMTVKRMLREFDTLRERSVNNLCDVL